MWQAIRPLGRALSVHQGKGATHADARLGALLEAVESDCAERFVSDGPLARYDALSPMERAADPRDFCVGGTTLPDHPIRWAAARELCRGGTLHVPETHLSLDLTRDTDGPIERSSGGLSTGVDVADAATTGLLELIERDAMIEWRAAGPMVAMRSAIDPASVPFAWFALWCERLRSAGVRITAYRMPSLVGVPVFACELSDRARAGTAYRATHGSACRADPELALFAALAEAIQSRATFISGARDDLDEDDFAPASGIVRAFGPPPPDGGRPWDGEPSRTIGLDTLVRQVSDAGYGRIGLVELARPAGLAVVRMVVPGWARSNGDGVSRRAEPAGRVVAFAGPSLPSGAAARWPLIEFRGPAVCGDVLELLEKPPLVAVLIDGCFDTCAAVRHKELLMLAAVGTAVLGAASMGALRAAELAGLGMIGVGRVFRAYRAGRLTGDDEVALLHAPAELGWRPLTVAMVELRAGLSEGRRRGWWTMAQANILRNALHAIHFADRDEAKVAQCCEANGLDGGLLLSLLDDPRVSIKRDDAARCLDLAMTVPRLPPIAPPPLTCFTRDLARARGVSLVAPTESPRPMP